MASHTGPHKYIRVKIGKNKRVLFRCNILGCVHTCREELVLGRKSICNGCGNEMFMTKYNMRLASPHCDDCVVRKEKQVDKIAELIKDMNI